MLTFRKAANRHTIFTPKGLMKKYIYIKHLQTVSRVSFLLMKYLKGTTFTDIITYIRMFPPL